MKILVLFGLLLLAPGVLFGQKRDHELRAYLDNKQFYGPTVGNYIEFHLQFVGTSVNYKGKDDGLIGELAVFLNILSEDSMIVEDAYRLESPFMKDSIIEDFYDLQRFKLDPGKYVFNIKLQDLNSKNAPLEASVPIVVDDLSESISFSDIIVAEAGSRGDGSSAFYKAGYDIIPRLSTFYPEQLNRIPMYFEVYGTDLLMDSVFGIKQSVIDAETNIEIEKHARFSKHPTGTVVPLIKSIDISDLYTGKYIIKYTIMNKNMQELSEQVYEFERSKAPEIDYYSQEIILDPAFQSSIPEDSIGYFLESLIPISGHTDVRNIIGLAKEKNKEKTRKFIQQYWSVTNPDNPYEAWMAYKAQVQMVEHLYANNFQEGFETDRGRVYLQYGPPSHLVQKLYSPSEYPYEIWQYNKIGVFSNKRFIFYNPDLVNNAFRLLHSDMVGELKNPAWPRELAKRNSSNGNVDNPNSGNADHWGQYSDDLFRQY